MAKIKCLPNKRQKATDTAQRELAGLCKALAHPTRVEIIKILHSKGECISGDLADYFDKAHSTISEHLKILKDSGLVIGTIDGPKRCYCVDPIALKKMKQLVNLLIFDPSCCEKSISNSVAGK